MAETYLQAIEKYLINRKDFNTIKFYSDTKQLFIVNSVLKTEELEFVEI